MHKKIFLYLLLFLFGIMYQCLYGAIPSRKCSIKAPAKWGNSVYEVVYDYIGPWLGPWLRIKKNLDVVVVAMWDFFERLYFWKHFRIFWNMTVLSYHGAYVYNKHKRIHERKEVV